MHPLKTNMRLATAAAAQACGDLLSQEEEDQLRYADMLLDVSNNRNSPWCQVIQQVDDITTPGQLYVALSRVHDCNNIIMYLLEKQLMIKCSHSTGFMQTANNIVYQDVLVQNS